MKSDRPTTRSEEHTSELQSHDNLVCRLLLEKKKETNNNSAMGCRFGALLVETGWGTHSVHSTTEHLPTPTPHGDPSLSVFLFFFFKERGTPKIPPFSPPRPFPI